MIETSHSFSTPRLPSKSSSLPANRRSDCLRLANTINELLLGNGFSPITNSEKYKQEHVKKIGEWMDSFDPEEISKAVSCNRKVDDISTPRFQGKKFVYFAEKCSDHLPYKITCDFSRHDRKPSIQCEVLPFA